MWVKFIVPTTYGFGHFHFCLWFKYLFCLYYKKSFATKQLALFCLFLNYKINVFSANRDSFSLFCLLFSFFTSVLVFSASPLRLVLLVKSSIGRILNVVYLIKTSRSISKKQTNLFWTEMAIIQWVYIDVRFDVVVALTLNTSSECFHGQSKMATTLSAKNDLTVFVCV